MAAALLLRGCDAHAREGGARARQPAPAAASLRPPPPAAQRHRQVRNIQQEVRDTYNEAAFIEIVPDSAHTTRSALEGMGRASRRAEHDVLLALLRTLEPGPACAHPAYAGPVLAVR